MTEQDQIKALAAAREIHSVNHRDDIIEAIIATKGPHGLTEWLIEHDASIIQKHYAAKDADLTQQLEIAMGGWKLAEQERDQLKARVAKLEKAIQTCINSTSGEWMDDLAKLSETLSSPSSDSITRLQELERKAKALDWLEKNMLHLIPSEFYSTSGIDYLREDGQSLLSAIEAAYEKK